jgi:hypothetical protein
MPTDNPLKAASEVKEEDSLRRSPSPPKKVMRELTGTSSTVPENTGAQWFSKTAADIMRPKTPEKSGEVQSNERAQESSDKAKIDELVRRNNKARMDTARSDELIRRNNEDFRRWQMQEIQKAQTRPNGPEQAPAHQTFEDYLRTIGKGNAIAEADAIARQRVNGADTY